MDKFDREILNLLTQNARQSVTAIGEVIGLSRTAVNERIRKLEDLGVIQRYTIEVGDQAQKQKVCAYFEMTFRPFDLKAVKKSIQAISEIRQAHALSGATDVLVYVEARSMERLMQVRQQLAELEHLDKIVTSTALEQMV
ncbi:Lrp/AsnC family transcriptional regulator [Pontibacterium sp. N1Y112]|uniref:Lrp/AsnC family transcriptional regulator n=1 Tax=Pontibacterium sinense TaxID=2781979 RepID=A0A8J7FRV9_9GAMM|nr:Lrp/AsnC family transcriptional regulator [Pontibacterium sinense]MBE9398877.1 Lrp/AsnC family transcriptional regulator [Pontibacterium sinense]